MLFFHAAAERRGPRRGGRRCDGRGVTEKRVGLLDGDGKLSGSELDRLSQMIDDARQEGR